MTAPATIDPVVEFADLAAWPAVRLIDARRAGSDPVPGAMRAPVEAWEAAARSGQIGFGDTAYWQDQIARLGVDNISRAVVFDGGDMTEAARVWFILQYFGVQTFLLNGGRDSIIGAIPPPPLRPFTARPGSGLVGLVDRAELKSELRDLPTILDARTEPEFKGEDLRRNPRGGHLPGARLLPHGAFLDQGRVKPATDLRPLFAKAGLRPDAPLITHCDGGGRAALAAVAAVRAGFMDVRAYYLSFADWARDDSCPVETGPS